MNYRITERRDSVTPDELKRSCEIFCEAFRDHPTIRYENPTWTEAGVHPFVSKYFQDGFDNGRVWLATRQGESSRGAGVQQAQGGKGEEEIVGVLMVRFPSPTETAAAEDIASSSAIPPSAQPEFNDGDSGHWFHEGMDEEHWRRDIFGPWRSDFWDAAYGSPTLPAVHTFMIFVDPHAHGGGIGKALMQRAKDLADQMGIRNTLMTQEKRSLEWYMSMGYHVVLHGVVNYPRWGEVDRWAMVRPPSGSRER